jgi:LuxR family maltose regulon positive regulatory protein
LERGFLLKTKLFVPQSRGTMVDRPRLTARLRDGLSRKLTLISAPPGFGKSSVLVGWRATPEGRQFPLAWVSLDEADNDPARFWFYVIHALEPLQPGVGVESLALLQSAQPVPIPVMLQPLINGLAEAESDFALVLEDYHLVESAPIHEGIAFLLEHLPPQMHLVITTRADPPLPLSRLRGRGEMVEIRVKELRFTGEEAAQFLREAQGLDLATPEIEALTARTEGWVTGLQLASLSLKETEDLPGFMAALTGHHRYIVDYLMEEVLQRQPAAVQRFLLETSLLPRLSGPLCDAVTGQPGSQALLERLEQSNLFTVALDAERHWFRYHHLMATVLRTRLQQTRPEAAAALYERASAWFESEGMLEEAMRMALEGRQFERVADLLATAADRLWRTGETATIRSFLDGLPAELVRRRADLSLIRTRLCLAGGDFLRAGEALSDAEALLESDRTPQAGEAAAYRSVLERMQGDLPVAIERAHAALALLPGHPVSWGPVAALSLAMGQILTGDVPTAIASMELVERLADEMGDAYYAVMAGFIRGELEESLGELHRAYASYQRAERASRSRPGLMPNAGMPLVGMGRVLLEWNDLEAAAPHIDEGLRRGRATSHMDTIFRGFSLQLQLRVARADLEGAEAVVAAIDEWMPATPVPQVALLLGAARAALYLVQGKLGAAAQWVRQAEPMASRLADALQSVALTLAHVEVATGRPEQALGRLEPLVARLGEQGMVGAQLLALLVVGLAHQAKGDRNQAAAAVRQAVLLGREPGYCRSFLAAGAPMAALLALPQVREAAPEYVDRLLAQMGPVGQVARGSERPPGAQVGPRPQSLAEPLTEREIELLGLLAAGLSNQAIAERLYIVPGTTKRHVHNILGKLDAANRTEAVAKARALGLL